MGKCVIAVTGTPGAWTHKVGARLVQLGMFVEWPGQDVDIKGRRDAINRSENPELIRIHESMLMDHGQSWFSLGSPRFYDIPHPGPKEYLNMFPEGSEVLLVDPRLSMFFPMWNEFVSHVFVCNISVGAAASWMHKQSEGKAALDLCRQVAEHYKVRREEMISTGMDRCTVLSYDSIVSGEFVPVVDGITKVLFGRVEHRR